MHRRRFLLTSLAGALAAPLDVEAQQADRAHRIGYLSNSAGIGAREEAFRSRLRELGYAEGRNLVIEWRFTRGRPDRHPDLAAGLVRLNVDCIVTVGVAPTRAAKNVTTTTPIVMADADDDPVRQGLVASLARPGGNVTGTISTSSDLAGKRLDLLKEAFPTVSRVAILYDPRGPGSMGHVREAEVAAPTLGLHLQPIEVRAAELLEAAFRTVREGRAEALIVVAAALMNAHRARIVGLATRGRLPVMYTNALFVRDGGLMSYSADVTELSRRAATYVDRILRGTNPADLPVEQPTKFELLINLKTAEALGLTIPRSLQLRADEVIR